MSTQPTQAPTPTRRGQEQPAARAARTAERLVVGRASSARSRLVRIGSLGVGWRGDQPDGSTRAPMTGDGGVLIMDAMTITDYLINLLFVFVVVCQARERAIDRRYFVIPVGLVLWVASQYLHALPTAGNDLVLVAGLAAVGVALGTISGVATRIRRDGGGVALARVGWVAGILLVAGISSRMVFAFALSHGLEPAVRSFGIAHHIGAAAWPAAMVLMALCEVGARLSTVYLRTRRLAVSPTAPGVVVASAA
jgi:hypothetical protein